MKVFINEREGLYSGGLIIVAADSPEEAEKVLLAKFPDELEMFDKDGDTCFDESECITKEHWFYKSKNWVLLPGVTSSSLIPAFLAESGHTE